MSKSQNKKNRSQKDFSMNRREFLRVSGALSAGIALAATGCQMPVEDIVPFVERPEGLRTLGKPLHYATVLNDIPVTIRTREGKPILVTPSPGHPSQKALTLATHAAILDLYDPDRAQGPQSVQRGKILPMAADWKVLEGEIRTGLSKYKNQIAIITPPVSGPAAQSVFGLLRETYGVRHIQYQPYYNPIIQEAWSACFGESTAPKPRFDKASLLVGFGAEFLDFPANGSEQPFAKKHNPEDPDNMSRFVAFESRLSLTGANADRRYRVRDSHLPLIALAIANELIIVNKRGPLGANTNIAQALAPYSAEIVSKKTGVSAANIKSVAAELVEANSNALVWASGSASTGAGGKTLEVAVNLINYSLGSLGNTIELTPASTHLPDDLREMTKLVSDMKSGTIKMLLVHNLNPAYDLPEEFGFKDALNSLELSISLNDRLDETSMLMDYLAPASHAFESWSDAELDPGILAIQQPVIRPLYNTFGALDILIAWGSLEKKIPEFSFAIKKATDGKTEAAENHSPAYHFIQTYWERHFFKASETAADFRTFWEDVLRNGYLKAASVTPPAIALNTDIYNALLDFKASDATGLELQIFPHSALYDGASANNGWLLEFPDPISRVSWGDWLAIAPKRFDEMGLTNGDLIKISFNGRSMEYPAYRQAGMHYDQIALPGGFGRTAVGEVGNNVGRNAFATMAVSNGALVRSGIAVTIAKTGDTEPLAIPQGGDVIARDRRPLVPAASLEAYKKDPTAGTGQIPGGPSAWSDHEYKGIRWAMAIDLSRCNGCGKCTLACQSENNIPVVGKQGVIDGREMSWIRIDRYYDAPSKEGGWSDAVWEGPLEVVEEPKTLFEPMLCQHCENAPCETVCPFVATMHSADGINQQVYNRCVGTRYCSNNCPFKVRRFNWFEYSEKRTNFFFNLLVPQLEEHARLNVRGRMQMKNNPEVTVRSRGVMEKCSFCIQRIREALSEAKRQGRPKKLKDGEVMPACMEACPTDAIVFGNINDPNSRIAKLAKNPRAMRLLELTEVKPSISYLTKVRND